MSLYPNAKSYPKANVVVPICECRHVQYEVVPKGECRSTEMRSRQSRGMMYSHECKRLTMVMDVSVTMIMIVTLADVDLECVWPPHMRQVINRTDGEVRSLRHRHWNINLKSVLSLSLILLHPQHG